MSMEELIVRVYAGGQTFPPAQQAVGVLHTTVVGNSTRILATSYGEPFAAIETLMMESESDPGDLELQECINILLHNCSPPTRERHAQIILKVFIQTATHTPKLGQSWQQLGYDKRRLEEYVEIGGEELVDKLLESQKGGDYSYLRDLTKLSSTQEVSDITAEGVQKAFKEPFVGDLSLLKEHIELLSRTQKLYSASFAIIQSSGTGKSRLVHELAAEYPVFSLCLRPPNDETSLPAWPPCDKPVYDYFNNYKSMMSDRGTRRIAVDSFLNGLFSNAIQHLGKNPADWREKFADKKSRTTFYEKVLKTAKETQGAAEETQEDIAYYSAEKSLKKLRSSIEPCTSDDCVPVVVCFDNAEGLSYYSRSLTNAFADLKYCGAVGIYLSTNLDLAVQSPVLPPDAKLPSSTRVVINTGPSRTFTELPFDVFAHTKFMGPVNEFSLDKIRSTGTTASLGRPMWTAHLNAGCPVSELLKFASDQLAGTRITKSITDTGKLAVLTSRLLIQCRPSQAPAQDLVASHLATLYYSSHDRSETAVGYPPEPFVSAAAFRLMVGLEPPRRSPALSIPDTSWDPDVEMSDVSAQEDVEELAATPATQDTVWVGWLREILRQDWVSPDHRGKLVSRVILTLARDQAYAEDHGPAINWDPKIGEDKVLPGHSSVRLTTFIKKLVGQAAWSDLRQMGPVNLPGGKSLEDFFEKSVIDFTCFTATDDRSIFTFDGMVSALLQGAGVVCEPKQPVYDHVIPFLIDKDKGLVEGNIGIIGERAQDWKAVSSPIIDPCQEGVLGKDHRVPVITIVFRHGRPVMAASKFSREPEQGSTYNDPPPPPHYQLLVGMTPVITTDAQLDIMEAGTPLGRYRHSIEASFGGKLKVGDFATKGVEINRAKRIYGVSADSRGSYFRRDLSIA